MPVPLSSKKPDGKNGGQGLFPSCQEYPVKKNPGVKVSILKKKVSLPACVLPASFTSRPKVSTKRVLLYGTGDGTDLLGDGHPAIPRPIQVSAWTGQYIPATELEAPVRLTGMGTPATVPRVRMEV